ncbi:hypothetical protein B0H11DRAFT_2206044 [Mycena galericulata]|nr:hypothetical protein B0H11DRAFT_2206044 [Mycena galericulata]
MASFTTALLGSFSRLFFPSSPSDTRLGISTTQSDPDIGAERSAAENHLRPASSASVRPRPSSTIEGYWSWEGPHSGVILRRRAGSRDLGLKGLAEVKITHASPVLACRPPRVRRTASPGDGGLTCPPEWASSLLDLTGPTPDSSFDISLISDTSTTTSEEHESESDTSFTLPPPPAPIGLGISGLFKPDGSAFDGMGVVSFGCDAAEESGTMRPRREDRGLSRTFLEEAAWTWAADPHHRMLSVIDEGENEPEEVPQVQPSPEQNRRTQAQEQVKRKTRATRPGTRDLSTVNTISSELKRQTPRAKASSTAAPAPRSPSVVPGARRAAPTWRS